MIEDSTASTAHASGSRARHRPLSPWELDESLLLALLVPAASITCVSARAWAETMRTLYISFGGFGVVAEGLLSLVEATPLLVLLLAPYSALLLLGRPRSPRRVVALSLLLLPAVAAAFGMTLFLLRASAIFAWGLP